MQGNDEGVRKWTNIIPQKLIICFYPSALYTSSSVKDAQEALSVGHWTSDWKVAGLNPALGRFMRDYFHIFCFTSFERDTKTRPWLNPLTVLATTKHFPTSSLIWSLSLNLYFRTFESSKGTTFQFLAFIDSDNWPSLFCVTFNFQA